MTSNDIEKLQILATTKDCQHLITFSDDRVIINMVVSFCKFAKLKDELFEQCSLKELMEE